MNNFIRSQILGVKSRANILGILKSLILNHTCCPTSNCTCLCILLACLSYFLWACSNNLLAWAYISSHPLTISTASLEWSFIIYCGILSCRTHMVSKNNFVELKVVMIVFVRTIFANLKKWSTTTKMVSIPFHSRSCGVKIL
jgi:hypothetical protein